MWGFTNFATHSLLLLDILTTFRGAWRMRLNKQYKSQLKCLFGLNIYGGQNRSLGMNSALSLWYPATILLILNYEKCSQLKKSKQMCKICSARIIKTTFIHLGGLAGPPNTSKTLTNVSSVSGGSVFWWTLGKRFSHNCTYFHFFLLFPFWRYAHRPLEVQACSGTLLGPKGVGKEHKGDAPH